MKNSILKTNHGTNHNKKLSFNTKNYKNNEKIREIKFLSLIFELILMINTIRKFCNT